MTSSLGKKQQLATRLQKQFDDVLQAISVGDMVTIDLPAEQLLTICRQLKQDDLFGFEQLTDLCGVDYLEYGMTDWRTTDTTESGFSRGVSLENESVMTWDKARYGVIYHLLSLRHNERLRIRVFLEPEPMIDSVIDIWRAADWYEREAFDLYGIVFEGHPDLRRLLTDYGFVGHPFRRDFPLIGEVELRYDAAQQRCVYEPVSIQPRVLVPRVIREDNRYQTEKQVDKDHE